MVRETVICTFRVRAESEVEFVRLMQRHWPTLNRLGLVTDTPPQRFRSVDEPGPTYVEMFEWAKGGLDQAHDHPEVLALWDPMEAMCEPRDGQPATEFPHFIALEI